MKSIKKCFSQIFYYILLTGILGMIGCSGKQSSPFSKSAKASLSDFELEPGFKIQLVASEPLIRDPVDMTIDEYGRMYVVEMEGMPLNRSGIGKVVLLRDTNGDGKMDSSTVFADSLSMPVGITRWKKGVIVTDPPNVYYMEDTDGDGKADIRETLLTGFDTSNLEANVNNPEYGLDNWIYLADLPVGNSKTGIYSPGDTGMAHLSESSMKFRPDKHQIKVLSGQTQFGQTFGLWGSHFLVNNSNHIYEDIIPNRYLQRNPNQIVPSATLTLADHNKVFPITKNPEYQMLTNIGEFTSACGLTAYLGNAFPKKYNENVTFVCEPVSNLVHADRLVPNGVSYKAERIADKHKAFLASTDPYSRLVNLYVGPDGALYVVDFYRQVIEGTEFMSQAVLDTVNLYNGTRKGRIYRISATGAKGPQWTKGLKLGDMSGSQLVKELANKNIWWRRNAQRLLVQRNTKDAVPSLIEMAGNKKSDVGRLHALWTLQGIGQLTPDLIIHALQDPVPGIRVNAIKLAELHLKSDPQLTPALLALQNDTSVKVQFQLLLTLGFLDEPEVNKARRNILFNNIGDNWFQIAALSASSTHAISLLDAILLKYNSNKNAYKSLINKLSAIIGKSKDAEIINQYINKAIDTKGKEGWQSTMLAGLASGLGSRDAIPEGLNKAAPVLIKTCLYNSVGAMRKGAFQILQQMGLPEYTIAKAMHNAKGIIDNKKLPEEQRANAIDFMALKNPQKFQSYLDGFIKPHQPLQIQLSALKAILQIPGLQVSKQIIKNWETLSPDVRNEAISLFITKDKRTALLLDAMESGKINKGEISWPQSVRLRSLGNMALRKRARVLFHQKKEGRKDVIEKYQKALQLKGDISKGKMVFLQNCAVCHQIKGIGGRHFGPNLGTVHAWDPSDIMTNILDPNRSIAHGYEMWQIKLNNGKQLQGLISSETPTSITLTDIDNKVTHIARQDIKSLNTTGMSAMPIGLEKKINFQQMANLLAFLKRGK